MSRSYKKTPICKQQNTKDMKKLANKKIRQKNKQNIVQDKEAIKSGKDYKKEFCSYDICDYKFCDYLGKSKKEIDKLTKEDKDFRKAYRSK